MKIRNGFVSNSSSSSFCIYGIQCSSENLNAEIMEKLQPYEIDEDILKKLEENGMSARYCFETVYLGRSWKTIRDDETGAQFKANVEKVLKEILGVDVKCQTHEEAWFDG